MPLVVVVAATVLCVVVVVVVVVVVYLFNIALVYALEQTLHSHVILHE